MRASVVILLGSVVGWGWGCASNRVVLQASALQPHPRESRAIPGELVRSEKLYVFEPAGMRHVRVHSSAQFVVVTRDRVRFHVALGNVTAPPTDKDQVTTASARVWLEDERGRRYPAVREAAYVQSMFHPQWRLPRNRKCPYACARHYRDIWLRQGTADYVFTNPELTAPERTKLVLNIVRSGDLHPLRFVWTFGDGTWVQHHYATPADADDNLFLAVPRADTMVRYSEPEEGTFTYIDKR